MENRCTEQSNGQIQDLLSYVKKVEKENYGNNRGLKIENRENLCVRK